jgi:hypothetical protein
VVDALALRLLVIKTKEHTEHALRRVLTACTFSSKANKSSGRKFKEDIKRKQKKKNTTKGRVKKGVQRNLVTI